jgi:hypothetical protein
MQTDFSRVLDLIDSAEGVLRSDGDIIEDEVGDFLSSLFEPTPIGPNGIDAVVISRDREVQHYPLPMFASSSGGGSGGGGSDNACSNNLNLSFLGGGRHQHALFSSYYSSSSSQQGDPCFGLPMKKKKKNTHPLGLNHLNETPSSMLGLMTRRPSKRQCTEMFPAPTRMSATDFDFEWGAPCPPQEQESLDEYDSSQTINTVSTGFRPYQDDQWMERFQEIADYKEANGHCLVPHGFQENPKLAQWIKRQRYQYRLKNKGQHSTLTDVRQMDLEQLGFVWDSHKAAWCERLESIREFRLRHGHANVPSNYALDRPLAVWVKCQRRQMKLLQKGLKTTMNQERFLALDQLGFEWNPRNL